MSLTLQHSAESVNSRLLRPLRVSCEAPKAFARTWRSSLQGKSRPGTSTNDHRAQELPHLSSFLTRIRKRKKNQRKVWLVRSRSDGEQKLGAVRILSAIGTARAEDDAGMGSGLSRPDPSRDERGEQTSRSLVIQEVLHPTLSCLATLSYTGRAIHLSSSRTGGISFSTVFLSNVTTAMGYERFFCFARYYNRRPSIRSSCLNLSMANDVLLRCLQTRRLLYSDSFSPRHLLLRA